ncbi:MAG: DNA adenine methylase [Candidatus Thorarchaeota archaeon]
MKKSTRQDNGIQLTLDGYSENPHLSIQFPATRYQGSKNKLIGWINKAINNLEFESVLDCFGGTGVVSYMFKKMGKRVTYNDYLKSNSVIAKALIENKETTLSKEKLHQILEPQEYQYDDFIERVFNDIYFTTEENKQLDIMAQNISRLTDEYEQAIAYFALFQSCIIKRPYNLFHRKNLYMRTSDVDRSFGNKVTWDRSFEEYMTKFTKHANDAVFDNGQENRALNMDVLDIPKGEYDLVYIDSPYISPKGVGVDYRDFYHFLEGLMNYSNWESMIDWGSKHRRLAVRPNPWSKPQMITDAFRNLFDKFKDSILVVSYRSPGIPSKIELQEMLESLEKKVEIFDLGHKYVLTKKRTRSSEILLIAT